MQINVLPTGILDQKKYFCAICLGSEKFPFEPKPVLPKVSSQFIKIVFSFNCDFVLKSKVTNLSGVITNFKLASYSWNILFFKVFFAMNLLLSGVANN